MPLEPIPPSPLAPWAPCVPLPQGLGGLEAAPPLVAPFGSPSEPACAGVITPALELSTPAFPPPPPLPPHGQGNFGAPAPPSAELPLGAGPDHVFSPLAPEVPGCA